MRFVIKASFQVGLIFTSGMSRFPLDPFVLYRQHANSLLPPCLPGGPPEFAHALFYAFPSLSLSVSVDSFSSSSHMGGCYSKLDKKNADGRNSRLPERRQAPGGAGVKAAQPLTPSSSSSALAPRRQEPGQRPSSGGILRSRLFGPRTSVPSDAKRASSSLIPRRGSADQRNNNSNNNNSSSNSSIARPASAASNGAAGRPPGRSTSGTSLASAGRATSKIPPPGTRAPLAKSDANANPSPQVEKATTARPARSRSGNREHPYSRQGGAGKAADGDAAAPSTNLAVQELQRLVGSDDTYKAFKVRRRRYISAPRSCYDNYNAENYTKRLSSETATSGGSSDSDRTLMSAGSSEKQKSATDITPSPSLTDTSPFPKEEEAKEVVREAAADHSASPQKTSSSAATVSTQAPPDQAATSSVDGRLAANEKRSGAAGTPVEAKSVASLGFERGSNPSMTDTRSPCGSQPLSIDSTADVARPSALSVSSLNSDDLMLTTDVGLDLEDDDIIKDIDDTEKEDPFLVANALATASSRSCRRGTTDSGEAGAVRSPTSPCGAAGSNLTTPETISSAMSLVRQATGPAINPVMTTSMPGRLPSSPKPSVLRKKSMPASSASDTAKSAVLRRFRAQSNVERPRSFSSPLRPPLRSRLASASSVSGQPGSQDGSNDELPVLLCQSDYRHLTQDMKSVKLLLLRLKGMLLEDEGHQPPFLEQLNSISSPANNLCTSTSSLKRSDSASEPSTPLTSADPFSPSAEDPPLDLETASREALVQEILMMRRNTVYLRARLAEREQTVKLLQQQMFALDGLSGGTEPPSPVVDPPCPPQASASVASLPNGDAIGLSPRPASRLRLTASARRERDAGQPLRPSFLPVNSGQQNE